MTPPSRDKIKALPAAGIGRELKKKGVTLAVAESCTGGLLGSLVTDVPGSSEYFDGGVVAYGNDAKKRLLGVSASTLRAFGAVSKETALEMASGIRKRLGSDMGVSITGIAGPGGASPAKPVGTVFICVSAGKKASVKKFLFKGSRTSIKRRSALAALSMLRAALRGSKRAR